MTTQRILSVFKNHSCIWCKTSGSNKFQRFSERTTIHGFVDLFYAKNTPWKIFWSVALLLSLGVTGYQVKEAIEQFFYQSPVTNIETVKPENIFYPPLKVCFSHWMYWVDWNKALLEKRFTKQSLLYGLSYLNTVYSHQLFNITESESELVRTMLRNNYTNLEQFYAGIAKPFPYANDYQEEPIGLDEIRLDYKTPQGRLICYVASGEKIAAILNFSQRNGETSFSPHRTLYLAIQDQFYYRLSEYIGPDEYNFYIANLLTQTTTYRFSSNKSLSERNLREFTLPLFIYPDGYGTQAVIVRYEHELYLIKLTVNVNRWKPKTGWPCNENKKFIKSAKATDVIRCQAKYNPRRHCECRDLYKAMLNNEDDFGKYKTTLCRNKIYFKDDNDDDFNKGQYDGNIANKYLDNFNKTTCLKNDTLIKKQEKCIEDLVPPCEQWMYQSTASFESTVSPNLKNEFVKNVTIVEITYPGLYEVHMLIETDFQTWEDFVGNVGGLLGVWTGASILSIVQLIYLCCFMVDTVTVDEQQQVCNKKNSPSFLQGVHNGVK